MERLQKQQILQDLTKKMVILTGPRQVGKTWLARSLMKEYQSPLYLNFDQRDHQKIILEESWQKHTDLIVFDEIHKMKKWKNYLKGVFDSKSNQLHILVTGSARLDTFRHAGDSLVGRFYLHRLLPFSLAEITSPTHKDENRLITRGGFPEPYLFKTDQEADRWRHQYAQGMIRYDVLDFERIHDFKVMQSTFEILRRSVGSAISYKSIAEDLSVAPNTIKKYIQILENLFIVFRVTPFSTNIRRSFKKEPKIYFYDTGLVIGDKGAQYENYLALSLHKKLLLIEDQKGQPTQLHYLKIKEGTEVDFCLVINNEVSEIIEAKYSNKSLHHGLKYFCEKYGFTGHQLIYNGHVTPHQIKGISIQSSFDYLVCDLVPDFA